MQRDTPGQFADVTQKVCKMVTTDDFDTVAWAGVLDSLLDIFCGLRCNEKRTPLGLVAGVDVGGVREIL